MMLPQDPPNPSWLRHYIIKCMRSEMNIGQPDLNYSFSIIVSCQFDCKAPTPRPKPNSPTLISPMSNLAEHEQH